MTFTITLTASDTDLTSIVLLDGESPGRWGVDAWSPGSSSWDTQWGVPRGNLGALPVNGPAVNRAVQLGLSCWPTDMQDSIALRADLGRVLEQVHRWGGRLTYQHTGQSHRQHLVVLAGGVETAQWTPRSELDGRHGVAVQLACAPHVEGDPLGWTETWSEGVVRWEATTGVTGDLTADQGGLRSSASGVHRVIRLDAYDLQDVQVTVSYTPGQVASSRCGCVLHHYANGDNLEVVARDTGSGTALDIAYHDVSDGTVAVWSTVTTATRVTAGHPAAIRARVNRGVVTASWWAYVATPDAWTTPTLTQTYSSNAATIDSSGGGRAGVVWTRNHTDDRVLDVAVVPSAADVMTGEPVSVRGVPGDVPAGVGVTLHLDPSTGGPTGSRERWGLVAVVPAMDRTLVTDGGFGLAVTPSHWDDNNYSGLLTTGKGTLTRDTSVARTGYGSGRVVTNGGAGQGVTHVMHHEFLVGVQYTASVWVRCTGSTQLRVRLGVSGDIASSAAVAPTSGWRQLTVTWTPTATRWVAYLVVEQPPTGVATWWVDDATVTEGSVPSPRGGWGGHQCDGLLTAVDTVSTTGVIQNTGAGSAYLHGQSLSWSSVTVGSGAYMLDTSQLTPGDLSGTVMVEVWLKASVPTVAVNLVAYAHSPNDTNPDHRTYTLEHGSNGVTVTPGSPNQWNVFRLGTLPLTASSDPTELVVSQTYGSSQSWSWSHLIVVPASSRASSPTGLTDLTGYPVFASTTDTGGESRRLTSDLRGLRRKPGTDAWAPAPPLEGPVLEAAPGDNVLTVTTNGTAPGSSGVHGSAESTRRVVVEPSVTPRWRHLRDA